MCNAGSYLDVSDIEAENLPFVKKGTKYLFVTTADLAKKAAKELKENGERLYSHTAIHEIFGVKPGVGIEKEVDFSDPDLMPAEIADAIKKGKFVGVFYNESLLSEEGLEKFNAKKEEIEEMEKEPKNGKSYAITEAFWKIFKLSKANRAEAWA